MKIDLNYETELIAPSLMDLDDEGNFTQEKEILINGQEVGLFVSYWFSKHIDKGDYHTPDYRFAEFQDIYCQLLSDDISEEKLVIYEDVVEKLIKQEINLSI